MNRLEIQRERQCAGALRALYLCCYCQAGITTAHFTVGISETEIQILAPLCSNLQFWGSGLFDPKDWVLFTATPHHLST